MTNRCIDIIENLDLLKKIKEILIIFINLIDLKDKKWYYTDI